MSKTLIIIILNESGSMKSTRNDVCKCFNSYIEKQKKLTTGQTRLYLLKFNSEVNVFLRNIELNNVPKLDYLNYFPEGSTAIYDAVAEGIGLAERDKKPDENVIVVTISEGEDNLSKKTSRGELQLMMKNKLETKDWSFSYFGDTPLKPRLRLYDSCDI